ncbi:hypothetical protein HDG40_001324 [Paraburkholderia sp. JPY158]|uniref:Uncharacterized protein n=1 Tax=Paraburkholderia atlantica TaxID=2654982 RepID=A0A7W8Q3N1_PARAM|nr:hypothetical protein [Paraburkholderia atlantica]
MQQDERLFEHGELAVLIVDEVRRQIAAIELQAFDHVEFIGQRLAVFDGDHAFLADAVDRFRNALTDRFFTVGRDGRNLCNLFAGGGRLADLREFFDGGDHCLVDAALQIERIEACRHILLAFAHDGLREHSGCRRAVTGGIAGFRRDFLHELRADVLQLVRKLDFLRHRYTVLRDDGTAETPFEHDVTAFRAERDLHRIGEQVDAFYQFRACVIAEGEFFSCRDCILLRIESRV